MFMRHYDNLFRNDDGAVIRRANYCGRPTVPGTTEMVVAEGALFLSLPTKAIAPAAAAAATPNKAAIPVPDIPPPPALLWEIDALAV